MRLLLDENLPVSLVRLLKEREGWDTVHVRTLGMQSSQDAEVLARAAADGRVLVSADTDFGTLLAASAADGPSVVLLSIGSGRRAERIAAMLGANLPITGSRWRKRRRRPRSSSWARYWAVPHH